MSEIHNVHAGAYWHPCDPKDATHQKTEITISVLSNKTIEELDPKLDYSGLICEVRDVCILEALEASE